MIWLEIFFEKMRRRDQSICPGCGRPHIVCDFDLCAMRLTRDCSECGATTDDHQDWCSGSNGTQNGTR